MNRANRKLSLIWIDLLKEQGGEETVINLKREYSSYSVESLVEEVKFLLKKDRENHPCKYQVHTMDFLMKDEYTVVYSDDEIDYKDLLISLVTLMQLINIEDQSSLIMELAYALQRMDREISYRFAKDIAERVRWEYR